MLYLPLAATDVNKAIELVFLISISEEFHTSHAPLRQFIQNGHHTPASWSNNLFENAAESSGLDFFKTESVELLQYSWNSLPTVLLRGSTSSSRTFWCANAKFTTVFHFLLQRITIIDFILSWNELYVSTQPLGLTITFTSVVVLPRKSSTFSCEKAILPTSWGKIWSCGFEVGLLSSFAELGTSLKPRDFFTAVLSPDILSLFLAWGLRSGEETVVGKSRLNLP